MTAGPDYSLLPGFVPWPADVAAHYRQLGVWQGQSIGSWFAARAAEHAHRTAVVDRGRRISYQQLLGSVTGYAERLIAVGLQPRERVLVQLPNSLELLICLLGTISAGGIPVLALPQHRQLELQAFVERAKPAYVVLAQDLLGASTQALGRLLLEQSAAVRLVFVLEQTTARTKTPENTDARIVGLSTLLCSNEESRSANLPQVEAAEVALLQLSGGSTGVPKLIARTHDDYLYSVRQSARVCGLTEHSTYLAVLPMTHNFTLSSPGLLGVLDRGGTIVSCPNPSPQLVFELLATESVSIAAAVPSLVLAWVEALERRPQLRAALQRPFLLQVGGAKLTSDLAERALGALGCELQQVFGMAEGLVNYTRLDAPLHTRLHTQGRPMSEFDELRVVNPEAPEGPELPPGTSGELQTRGPYTIRGYYDNPTADLQSFTRDGFYRTFDLVHLTESGDVVVTGRIGDRILRGGEKIAPEEVERELGAHPKVLEVAIVGLADPVLGQRSCAFIVPRNDAKLGLSEVRAFLRRAGLAEFKLPDLVQLESDLPRTAVGKTDRSALRRAHAERRGDSVANP